jgi:catechol 2,3-dioxygenase-like lactoylglutathione lyase family enzyme
MAMTEPTLDHYPESAYAGKVRFFFMPIRILLPLILALILISLLYSPLSVANAEKQDPVGLVGRIHFNTQTSDFDRARAFYRLLGYSQGRNNFPKTNTYQMARSLGMYDLCTYEIEQIEVMQNPGILGPANIDLIQFKKPYNPAPPYAAPNHLGMAYAAFETTNLDADYAYLVSQRVEFVTPPFGDVGNRFAFFKDPDGVFYKLIENSSAEASKPSTDRPINIISMPYVAINVSDLDTALAFYNDLGYTDVEFFQEHGTLAEAQAYGLDTAFSLKGADISLPVGDKHHLRLTQWQTPFDPELPYPAPISHIGIDRIALAVHDLDRAVEYLSAQGVSFLSEVAPCCSGTGADTIGIINALDPDGTFIELVGPIQPRPLKPLPKDCK